jgi:superfamily II DNA helicase RecQ
LEYIREHLDSTGIVYCMTRADTENLADFLRKNGVIADYYHAGQTPKERKRVQHAWLVGKVKVVCATIAYGMV